MRERTIRENLLSCDRSAERDQRLEAAEPKLSGVCPVGAKILFAPDNAIVNAEPRDLAKRIAEPEQVQVTWFCVLLARPTVHPPFPAVPEKLRVSLNLTTASRCSPVGQEDDVAHTRPRCGASASNCCHVELRPLRRYNRRYVLPLATSTRLVLRREDSAKQGTESSRPATHRPCSPTAASRTERRRSTS